MKKTLVLALIIFAAACGDDSGSGDHDDAGPVDGHGSDAPTDTTEPTPERAVTVSGDFSAAGLLSVANVEAKTIQTNVAPATSIGKDPVMRKLGNELFVVNRDTGNSVTILKASDYSLVEMVGTGANTNPQDVATVGNKVYVAVYKGKGLKVFTRGSSTVTDIDLSADDPDMNPDCASVYAVGTKVYVACQLKLDTDPSMERGNGKVYVVDTTTDTKVATLTLSTHNPFGLFAQLPAGSDHPTDLVIGTTDFGTGGCLERVTTGATPTAPGCLIQNTALGGYATRVDFSATTAYAVITDTSNFTADVKTLTLANDTVGVTNLNAEAVNVVDVAVCPSGKVVLTDAGASAGAAKGIHIYSSTGTELTSAPLDIGQKPGSTWGLVCY